MKTKYRTKKEKDTPLSVSSDDFLTTRISQHVHMGDIHNNILTLCYNIQHFPYTKENTNDNACKVVGMNFLILTKNAMSLIIPKKTSVKVPNDSNKVFSNNVDVCYLWIIM